jgi:hypothetical protein
MKEVVERWHITNVSAVSLIKCVSYKIIKKKLRGLSPQANYTDRVTAAVGEVVPTFAGRECYVVSATDPTAVNLGFLGRSRYFFIQVAPQL